MVQNAVSEDCLYLNVWTAAQDTGERRPVLVYIHGGGFSEGSGAVAVYDGESLAAKGLVVVTINYRLGVFGFLAHPELTAESSHNASGNYGLLDQIAALQWIRANVAAFGGDPERVAIAGQSAGAISVYLLTASPLAKGLFHRAIVQSGPGGLASFGLVSARTLARALPEAEQAGVQFAAAKGASSLQDLRARSADELMAPSGEGPPVRFGTVIDGWFLPDDVEAIYAAGQQNDTPMLNGMNADEASAFPGYGTMTADAFRQQAQGRYGDEADAFLRLYPAGADEEAGSSQKASTRDLGLVALRRLAAQRGQTAQTPLYLYYFDRAIPWPEHPEFGAFHTGEVPYVFDTLHLLDRPWEATDRALAETVSTYWVNFAAAGDPNGAGVPAWPAYDAASQQIMRLGDPVEARVIPAQEKAAFFEAYLERSQR